ncbi:hypothetical protein BDR04DRAFT_723540 [Suillus decipiens]|nr:hypothetical protein BDR04DRAFT_723540 [Suillus decipiens]
MTHIKNQHTYRLKNCQGGTAIDLAAYDNHSIVGFRPHHSSNQAWIFQQDDDQDGWFIKSSRTGQYLGIEGNAGIGTEVVAVLFPFKWDIRDSDVKSAKGIRISAHGTNLSLDLDRGSSANLTKIKLWRSWPGPNQIWSFTERIFIEDQHAYSLRDCQGGTAVNLSGDDNHSSKHHTYFRSIPS